MGFNNTAHATNITKANTLLLEFHTAAKYKPKLISHAIHSVI
jgi:hypothetical protein